MIPTQPQSTISLPGTCTNSPVTSLPAPSPITWGLCSQPAGPGGKCPRPAPHAYVLLSRHLQGGWPAAGETQGAGRESPQGEGGGQPSPVNRRVRVEAHVCCPPQPPRDSLKELRVSLRRGQKHGPVMRYLMGAQSLLSAQGRAAWALQEHTSGGSHLGAGRRWLQRPAGVRTGGRQAVSWVRMGTG